MTVDRHYGMGDGMNGCMGAVMKDGANDCMGDGMIDGRNDVMVDGMGGGNTLWNGWWHD